MKNEINWTEVACVDCLIMVDNLVVWTHEQYATMKCVCGKVFMVNDVVHEIYGTAPQLLCDKCYAFLCRFEDQP